jgi:hypothetical protein
MKDVQVSQTPLYTIVVQLTRVGTLAVRRNSRHGEKTWNKIQISSTIYGKSKRAVTIFRSCSKKVLLTIWNNDLHKNKRKNNWLIPLTNIPQDQNGVHHDDNSQHLNIKDQIWDLMFSQWWRCWSQSTGLWHRIALHMVGATGITSFQQV